MLSLNISRDFFGGKNHIRRGSDKVESVAFLRHILDIILAASFGQVLSEKFGTLLGSYCISYQTPFNNIINEVSSPLDNLTSVSRLGDFLPFSMCPM